MNRQYTDEHAEAGVHAELPDIETWPNQFPDREYEIEIGMPEFASVCPKPDSRTRVNWCCATFRTSIVWN